MSAQVPELSPAPAWNPPYAQQPAQPAGNPYARTGKSAAVKRIVPPQARAVRNDILLLQVILVGFMTFGKSFATIGIGPLMVAEPLLLYYFFRERGKVLGMLLDRVVRLRFMDAMVVAVFLWGMFDVARPVFNHRPILLVLRTSAFDYYPLFIFAGIRIGQKMTLELFVRFWKTFIVCYFFYTVLLYTVGAAFNITVPWGDGYPLLALQFTPPFAPLMLLSIWPLLKKWWFRWISVPILIFPMVESTGRAAFLGFGVGLAAVFCASRRHRGVTVSFLLGMSGLLTIVGPMIPGAKGRNENLDPIIQVARVVATVDPDFAFRLLNKRGYHDAAMDMITASGTAEWRKAIWRNCMGSLNTFPLKLMGQGHGAPLINYMPDGQNITTPHNFLIYAVFYTGEVGAAFFILMLISMLFAGRKIRDPQVWALFTSNIVMTVTGAAVGNALETPMVSVPFYLISGICLGMGLASKRQPAALPNPYRYDAMPTGMMLPT